MGAVVCGGAGASGEREEGQGEDGEGDEARDPLAVPLDALEERADRGDDAPERAGRLDRREALLGDRGRRRSRSAEPRRRGVLGDRRRGREEQGRLGDEAGGLLRRGAEDEGGDDRDEAGEDDGGGLAPRFRRGGAGVRGAAAWLSGMALKDFFCSDLTLASPGNWTLNQALLLSTMRPLRLF